MTKYCSLTTIGSITLFFSQTCFCEWGSTVQTWDAQNLSSTGPEWDAHLWVWDAKIFGSVSPGTHRSKFVKKSLGKEKYCQFYTKTFCLSKPMDSLIYTRNHLRLII